MLEKHFRVGMNQSIRLSQFSTLILEFLIYFLKTQNRFDISIEVSSELTALSNMHVVNEQKTGEGTKLVKFATTPLMSTYLVAFAVGDFTSIRVC